MIIETSDGAVLELFWRRRGPMPWSPTTALHFLSRYTTDRHSIQGVRWLLSWRGDTGRTWQSSDSELLERTASLLATNRVIVTEFGGTERWPGSGFILGSGPDSSLLFWTDQLHLHRDVYRAQEWVTQMQALIDRAANAQKPKDRKTTLPSVKEDKLTKSDEGTLRANGQHVASLRDLISSNPELPQYESLSDRDFLQIVLTYLEEGDLLPIYHRYPGVADPGPDKPADGPPPPRASSSREEPDDPSENPVVPGVCLLCAANEGAPFVTMPKP
jgi:hypothetical protein